LLGVRIINVNWGSSDKNPVLEEEIKNSGILFVAAVENSGTSFSVVSVSGVAALILTNGNNLTALEIKQRTINTSDKVTSLYSKTNNERKVKCGNAL